MSGGDLGNRPYSPDSAQAKRAIHSPDEELWNLKSRVANTNDARDKYMSIKHLAALEYSRFGELRRNGSTPRGAASPKEWAEDWESIKTIYSDIFDYEVEMPKMPALDPIAFRFGLPQYEVVNENQETETTLYAGEVKGYLELRMKLATEEILWRATNRLERKLGELDFFLTKYGIWDSQKRVYYEVTGYNRDVREAKLSDFMSVGGGRRTSTPPDSD